MAVRSSVSGRPGTCWVFSTVLRTRATTPSSRACGMPTMRRISRRTRKVSPSSGSATPRCMSRRRTPTPSWDNMFPSLNKFDDPFRSSINETRGSRDFFVARLAETYLIAAEALMRDGRAAEGLPYINAVRRRAAIPGHETEMELTVDQLTQDEILNERARELAGEIQRWFDLVRTHSLVSRVKLYNADGGPNIKAFHVLRPIPQIQIDRTSIPYPQNPGY